MKKKITIISLVFALLSNMNMVFAADFADIKDNAVLETAVSELVSFEVINGYEDGTFKPENKITRAEVCTIISRAIPQGKSSVETMRLNDEFADVQNWQWFYDDVLKMSDFGIVNGYGDGTFRPENDITYQEYIKMLVSMLFYQPKAEGLGGYPDGYISVANEIGITTGINFNNIDKITRADAAIMLNNALSIPILLVDTYDVDGENNYTVSDITYKKILSQK